MSGRVGERLKDGIAAEIIERKIYVMRGHKVMIDRDLAALYGVETRVLNQGGPKKIDRFPDDFIFQLSREEYLRCQNVISNPHPAVHFLRGKRGPEWYNQHPSLM